MLMSAIGGSGSAGGGMSGLGSLLSSSSGGQGISSSDETSGASERTTQLEREVSSLTNQNLRLQE